MKDVTPQDADAMADILRPPCKALGDVVQVRSLCEAGVASPDHGLLLSCEELECEVKIVVTDRVHVEVSPTRDDAFTRAVSMPLCNRLARTIERHMNATMLGRLIAAGPV